MIEGLPLELNERIEKLAVKLGCDPIAAVDRAVEVTARVGYLAELTRGFGFLRAFAGGRHDD